MKRLHFLMVLGIFSLPLIAQPDHGESERLQAARVAFISQKMELTPEEAEVFWPLYNEFKKKEEALRKKTMQQVHGLRKGRSDEGLSDEEIEQMIQKKFKEEEAILKLRREYHEKFKEVLPIKKVGKLYLAEHDFRRNLIENVRKRHSRD